MSVNAGRGQPFRLLKALSHHLVRRPSGAYFAGAHASERTQGLFLNNPFLRLDLELRAKVRALAFREITQREIPAFLVTHDAQDVPYGDAIVEIDD